MAHLVSYCGLGRRAVEHTSALGVTGPAACVLCSRWALGSRAARSRWLARARSIR